MSAFLQSLAGAWARLDADAANDAAPPLAPGEMTETAVRGERASVYRSGDGRIVILTVGEHGRAFTVQMRPAEALALSALLRRGAPVGG